VDTILAQQGLCLAVAGCRSLSLALAGSRWLSRRTALRFARSGWALPGLWLGSSCSEPCAIWGRSERLWPPWLATPKRRAALNKQHRRSQSAHLASAAGAGQFAGRAVGCLARPQRAIPLRSELGWWAPQISFSCLLVDGYHDGGPSGGARG
jgi:hypothetical protein